MDGIELFKDFDYVMSNIIFNLRQLNKINFQFYYVVSLFSSN